MLVRVKKPILEVETGPETSLLTFSPDQDEDPDTPKSVRFRVKETVCGKAERQLPEQCAFKEQGVVKQCMGAVTLNPAADSFDISCNEVSRMQGTVRGWNTGYPADQLVPIPT